VLAATDTLAIIALVTLAAWFPSADPWIMVIGTPIVIVGTGLGANFVQRCNAARRREGG
jgi:hypothetical protein